jgi:hypothetical protein
VWKVLKAGGTLAVIAGVYKGANTTTAKLVEKCLPKTGMTFLMVDEHRELLVNAGYSEIQITVEPGKGWICLPREEDDCGIAQGQMSLERLS